MFYWIISPIQQKTCHLCICFEVLLYNRKWKVEWSISTDNTLPNTGKGLLYQFVAFRQLWSKMAKQHAISHWAYRPLCIYKILVLRYEDAFFFLCCYWAFAEYLLQQYLIFAYKKINLLHRGALNMKRWSSAFIF